MNKTTQEGGCRCGQVRIKMTAPPFLTMACHCTGCQRMTGSAFSLSAAYPSNAFSVTQGEPVIGGLHGSPGTNRIGDIERRGAKLFAVAFL